MLVLAMFFLYHITFYFLSVTQFMKESSRLLITTVSFVVETKRLVHFLSFKEVLSFGPKRSMVQFYTKIC